VKVEFVQRLFEMWDEPFADGSSAAPSTGEFEVQTTKRCGGRGLSCGGVECVSVGIDGGT
jgi:hypothetical protein